jgi:hypothetical protein
VVPGRFELAPVRSRYTYVAFLDLSGGVSDAAALAIAHAEAGQRAEQLVAMPVSDC